MFLENPIIKRYSFSLFRKSSIIITSIIFAGVILLINFLCLFYLITNFRNLTQGQQVQELALIAYPWMLGLSVLIYWIIASFSPSEILFSQNLKGSQDFFDILPLKGSEKASGLLIGANLLFYPLALISLLLSFQYGLVAGLRLMLQLNIILAVLSFGLFFNIFSILASLSTNQLKLQKKNTNVTSPAIVIIIGIVLICIGIIVYIVNTEDKYMELDRIKWVFYFCKVPAMFTSSFIALALAAWGFLSLARKLNDRQSAYFSRIGAETFFFFAQFVLLGFFLPAVFSDGAEVNALISAFTLCSFFLMIFTGCSAVRSRKRMQDLFSRMNIPLDKFNFLSVIKILYLSNIYVFAILFILWFLPAVFLGFLSSLSPFYITIHLIAFTGFAILAAAIVEMYIMLNSYKWHYHFLVVFFAAAYQGLFFLGGLFLQNMSIMIFSFPGYLISMFETNNPLFKVDNIERIVAASSNFIIALLMLCGVGYIYYLNYFKKEKLGEEV